MHSIALYMNATAMMGTLLKYDISADFVDFNGEIINPFPNFKGATIEVWEWIRNFIPHFMVRVITYPCRD